MSVLVSYGGWVDARRAFPDVDQAYEMLAGCSFSPHEVIEIVDVETREVIERVTVDRIGHVREKG